MKIQIDIDQETWTRFREKVQSQGKTLREVVPTVIEPALNLYVDPTITNYHPPQHGFLNMVVHEREPDISKPPGIELPLKRCEVCDKMVDRLFHIPTGRACYQCWRSLQ